MGQVRVQGDHRQLHMSLVALAFACNYRRTASLQWGEPYDTTVYRVPSNDREWRFTYIQHQLESDASASKDPLAAQAHAEIDVARMKSLATGLEHFAARGLQLLNTLISAAIRDTGTTVENFGQGEGGQLDVMRT